MRNLGIFGNSVLSAPLAYSDVILADNPLGYWRFGESSGTTAVDVSGNNLNGVYNNYTYVGRGLPSLIPSDPDNKAILFKNIISDQYRFKANPGANWTSGNYSVEFVFKPATVSRQYQCLFYRGGQGITIQLKYNILEVRFGENGYIFVPDAIQDNTSYHVVVSALNVSSIFVMCSIFVNGSLKASGNASYVSATGEINAGVISGQSSSSYYGYMDELSVWNYALSQAQIQAHYAAMMAI